MYYTDCKYFKEDVYKGCCMFEDEVGRCMLAYSDSGLDTYCEGIYEPEDPDLWKEPN